MNEIRPARAPGDETKFYEDLLRSGPPLPEEIRRVEIRLDEEWDGSPAIRLLLFVDDDVNPSEEKLGRLHRAARALEERVLDAGTDRWPYARFVTE